MLKPLEVWRIQRSFGSCRAAPKAGALPGCATPRLRTYLILNYFHEQCNDLSRQPWQNRDKTPRPGGNRGKIQESAISVSCDRRQRKSKLVKTELGRATGILCGPDWCQAHDSVGCRQLDEHLLSRRSRPGRPRVCNVTTGPRRQTGFGALRYTTSRLTGLLGVGFGGDCLSEDDRVRRAF